MNCSSSLIDIADPLVLDTSVLINLYACQYGERILSAIPNDVLVPEVVAGELGHEVSCRDHEYSFLCALVESGIVELSSLSDAEYQIFHELTSTAPTLDDGEAATIAIAASRHIRPVIDEKRGRARAIVLMQALTPYCSLDLFRHPKVIAALGNQTAVEALYLVLRDGRMRIPSESADEVIRHIGIDRSRDCTCLPGYRQRFVSNQNLGQMATRLASCSLIFSPSQE